MLRTASLAAILGAAAMVLVAAAPVAAAPRAILPGHTPAFVHRIRPLGPAAGGRQFDVTLWLQPRDAGGLAQLAATVAGRGSGFLSPRQVQARFLPTAGSYRAVEAYLRGQGLRVTETVPNRLFVQARGTVAQVSAAFAVGLQRYRLHGRTVIANDGDPSLPASLRGVVAAIGGLDGAAVARPDVRLQGHEPQPFRHGPPPANAGAALCAGFAPNGTPGYIPCPFTPQGLRAATGLGGRVPDGAGQTVAIVDAYGSPTLGADVATFDRGFNLPGARFRQIGRTITGGSAADDVPGWQVETTLDVEWAHAFAPGAAINLYVAPNASGALFRTLDRIVATRAAHLISLSWGEPEYGTPAAQLRAQNTVFELAALEGIGVAAASGDCGDASACTGGVASAEFPASSPWVTAVGGLSLLPHQSPVAWGTAICVQTQATPVGLPACPSAAFAGGSGGGVSSLFTAPPWQTGATMRATPDVALNADPYTGAWVAFQGGFGAVGGTSLAAPTFTGLMALAHPYGLATPWLYGPARWAITPVGNGTAGPLKYQGLSSGNLYHVYFGYDQGLSGAQATGLGFPDRLFTR